jgi:hypothetical protein
MKRHIVVTGVVGAAALTAVVALSATPALAAGHSSTVAGYEIFHGGLTASATARFVVPTLTCSSGTPSGIEPSAVIFTAGGPSSAGVFAQCTAGAASYRVALTVNGTLFGAKFTPSAGDVIVVSVEESSSATTATIRDLTQSQSKKVTGAGGSPGAVLVGMNTMNNKADQQLPVAQFGRVGFSGAALNGQPLSAHATAINLKSVDGTVLRIKTGDLGTTGDSFMETWKSA